MYRPENLQKNFLFCIKPALSPELAVKRKIHGSRRDQADHRGIRLHHPGRNRTSEAAGKRTDGHKCLSGPAAEGGGMSWIFTPAKECSIDFSGVFCLPVTVAASTITFSPHDPYPADSAGYRHFFAEKIPLIPAETEKKT